jgi:hypothetical protein
MSLTLSALRGTRGLFLFCLLGASVALGVPPKTLVAGGGPNCKSKAFIATLRRFEEIVAARLGTAALPGQAVLDVLRPRTSQSVELIAQTSANARALFFSGQVGSAYDLAQQALNELNRVIPPEDPWPVIVDTLLVQALVHRHTDNQQGQMDVLRRIARVDRKLVLDPNWYTPSLIRNFEQAKRETLKGTTVLSVTSTPPGANVYLSGKLMGTTPFSQGLVPGDYRLLVASKTTVSFTRDLILKKGERIEESVDLATEGALSAATPLCFELKEPQLSEVVVRLADKLAVERVVLITEEGTAGTVAVKTILYAQPERAATAPAEQAERIVDFVFDGKPLPAPTQPSVKLVPEATVAPSPAAAAVSLVDSQVKPSRAPQVVVLTLGAITTVVAGIVAGAAASDFGQIKANRANLTYEQASIQLGRSRNVTNTALGIAGGGLLTTGLGVLWLFLGPKS